MHAHVKKVMLLSLYAWHKRASSLCFTLLCSCTCDILHSACFQIINTPVHREKNVFRLSECVGSFNACACVLSAASLWLLFACIWVCSSFWVVELLRKTWDWTAEVCRTHMVKLIWGKHKDHLFQLLLGRNTHFNSDNGFKIKLNSFPSLGLTCLSVWVLLRSKTSSVLMRSSGLVRGSWVSSSPWSWSDKDRSMKNTRIAWVMKKTHSRGFLYLKKTH